MTRPNNAIADYLHKYNIRPSEFARLTGVTRQTINEKLKRDRHTLTLATYEEVAKAVHKPVWTVLQDISRIEDKKRELKEFLE